MSVLIETSLGELVIDLETELCPRTCTNFLKLCKAYKYNYQTFFSVRKGFLAQTGDPTNGGNGGQSVWSMLPARRAEATQEQYFAPERRPTLKHKARGTVSMACRRLGGDAKGAEDEDTLVAGSQFFITLGSDIDYLDGKHAPFGQVVEGLEKGGTLDKINDAFVDKDTRPLRDIRIQHVVVLDDPFDDIVGLDIPSRTPSPTPEQLKPIGLDASLALDDPGAERPEEEVEEERRKKDADAAALTLELIGDLPFANIRPPENILFVCKLNPVTRSDDLELIFSRFGKILSCEVIKDKRTGDSLQYAFIEFDEQQSAEQAYIKMQNVLVDDRRIWVDFSQSVSKLSSDWNRARSGGKPVRVSGRGEASASVSGTPRNGRDMVFDFDDVPGSSDRRRDGRDGRFRDEDRRRRDSYHPYERDDYDRRRGDDRTSDSRHSNRREDQRERDREDRHRERSRHEKSNGDSSKHRRSDDDRHHGTRYEHRDRARHRHEPDRDSRRNRHSRDDYRERSPRRRDRYER